MTVKLSQNDRLLAYLIKNKNISQREALLDLGVQCLTRRIADLRELGYYIKTKVRKNPETGQRYARYHLMF